MGWHVPSRLIQQNRTPLQSAGENPCDVLVAAPWVPEDIFFLSTLMVRGKAALMRRKAPALFFFAVSIRKKYPLEPRVL